MMKKNHVEKETQQEKRRKKCAAKTRKSGIFDMIFDMQANASAITFSWSCYWNMQTKGAKVFFFHSLSLLETAK